MLHVNHLTSLKLGLGALLLAGLYLTTFHSYVLFHNLVELLSIVIAYGMFVVAWNSRELLKNNYLLFVGISYLFVASVDLFHTLSYQGMNLFQGEANLATQLWIIARFLQAATLLAAPLFLTRRLNLKLMFIIWPSLIAGFLLTVLYFKVFPDCFVTGSGLTTFKKTCEYLISGMLCLSTIFLVLRRRYFEENIFFLIAASGIVTIASELVFTSYISVYGTYNMLGHLLKLIAFYLMYRAVVETGIKTPYMLMAKELKQQQEKLENERDFISGVMDVAGALVAVSNPDGNVIRFNRTFKDVTGKRNHEIYAHKASEVLTSAADGSPFRFLNSGHANDMPQNFIDELSAADGSTRYISWSHTAKMGKDNTPEFFVSIGQDVTEKIKIAGILQMERDNLNSVLRSIQDGVCIIDQEYNVLFLNDFIISEFGPLENRKCYQYFSGFSEPCEWCRNSQVFNGETIRWEWFSERNGKYYHLIDTPVKIDGQLRKLETFRDITPLKEAQNALLKAHEGLEKRVEDRTAQLMLLNTQLTLEVQQRKLAEEHLKEKAEQLAKTNLELEQFAYVASHDLQEPLRNVAGSLQLLKRKCGSELSSEADTFIRYAVDSSLRMKKLIEGLLSYSRLGKNALDVQDVSSKEILNRSLENLKTAIQENNAEVHANGLPVISADPDKIMLVFQNLISNAIKFRGEEPPKISVTAHKKDEYWVFSVSDNGIGIAPEYYDKIFRIFQRLHRADEYPGTGIGLAMVKKIVETHGGHIWCEPNQNQGCTFSFNLPQQN